VSVLDVKASWAALEIVMTTFTPLRILVIGFLLCVVAIGHGMLASQKQRGERV